MTTLNDVFERELALEDEGCESGSKTSNLPLLLEELPEFTTLPAMKTSPWTLLLHVPQLPAS